LLGAANEAVLHLRLFQPRNPAKIFGSRDFFLPQTTTYVAEVRCSPLNAVLKASFMPRYGYVNSILDTLVGCLDLRSSRLRPISKYLEPYHRCLHRLLFFETDTFPRRFVVLLPRSYLSSRAHCKNIHKSHLTDSLEHVPLPNYVCSISTYSNHTVVLHFFQTRRLLSYSLVSMFDRPVDNWSLSNTMSTKSHTSSGETTRKRRDPTSTESKCEAHPNPPKLTNQRWNAGVMLGMWVSIWVVFAARKLLMPIERNRQPFYTRFLWAAIMVCISNIIEK
jgi:hypothetical protein